VVLPTARSMYALMIYFLGIAGPYTDARMRRYCHSRRREHT
jgi:hypothetical protein